LGVTLVPFEQREAILQTTDSLEGFFIFFPTINSQSAIKQKHVITRKLSSIYIHALDHNQPILIRMKERMGDPLGMLPKTR
jgi:hypothetical protein